MWQNITVIFGELTLQFVTYEHTCVKQLIKVNGDMNVENKASLDSWYMSAGSLTCSALLGFVRDSSIITVENCSFLRRGPCRLITYVYPTMQRPNRDVTLI